MTKKFSKIKNMAIIAHVDHGKTTMVDGLLRQSGAVNVKDDTADRIMDNQELEKERGITIQAKNCSFIWNDTKVNLLDTPGHADFGGEVERGLNMVDGALLLVDAAEGPLPQTRFVLQKAFEMGIKLGVVINKVDRPDQRIEEVKEEIEDLFLDLISYLEIDDYDLHIPFIYASAKEGWALENPPKDGERGENLECMLDLITSDYFPTPQTSDGEGLQLLVSNLSYSPYLGPQIIGLITRGCIEKNKTYTSCGKEKNSNFKVTDIQIFDALKTTQVDRAEAGEIVIVSGSDKGDIGDTICNTDILEPLPRIEVDPPTVSVNVCVNTSPFAGQDGEYLTSRKLEDFLIDACRHNVALKYEPTDDPKIYILKGRGELQLAIVFEELRRKGYEFMISRPEVVLKYEGEQKLEPFEQIVLDVPSDCTGKMTEMLAERKGKMENLLPISDTRTRMEFSIPSRGLIGLRSSFLTETRGEGLMSSYFLDYRPYIGKLLGRKNGAIIADRAGKATPYALFNLLSSGRQFILPGESVYEGMIVGASTRENDINVNAIRSKALSNVRTAGKDENIILPPIPPRTLDWAMSWIDNDEWVEVTPKIIRLRKKELQQNKRSVIRR